MQIHFHFGSLKYPLKHVHFCMLWYTLTLQGLLWAAALTKYIEFQISGNSSVLAAPETYTVSYSTNMAEEVIRFHSYL